MTINPALDAQMVIYGWMIQKIAQLVMDQHIMIHLFKNACHAWLIVKTVLMVNNANNAILAIIGMFHCNNV